MGKSSQPAPKTPTLANERGDGGSGARLFHVVAAVGLILAICLNLYAQWVSWNQPIIDQHGFRQTQTALSAFWLLHGGNWLAYETPVLGSPWSIPMEFPLYQWMVATVAWLTPISLDQAGRAVSQFVFFLCLRPLWVICRELGVERATWLAAAALMIAAPVYVFWSRAFMIESTALFLALAFVASYLRWINTGALSSAACTLIFLSLALLVKVTTAIPFGILAALLSIAPATSWMRERDWVKFSVRGSIATIVAVSGLLLAFWWTSFADTLKSLHPFGSALTSHALFGWNFGSLQQRTSLLLWAGTIAGRAVPDALGTVAVLLIVLMLSGLVATRAALLAGAFLLAWLSAFLIFTNLHIVHNYYQYSNAVLLVVYAAIVIGQSAQQRPVLATGVLVFAMSMQFFEFFIGYGSLMRRDLSGAPALQIAQLIQRETPPGSAIVVAIGDWSPVIAYYSERKSLTLPKWSDRGSLEAFATSPSSFVASLPISAVVICPGQDPAAVRQAAYQALSTLRVRRIGGLQGCEVAFTK